MSRRTQTALYGIFVFLMVLAVCIAYAQVVTELKVEGTGDGSEQEGVYITEVEYLANNGADTTNSKVNYYLGTMLDSNIILGSNASSSITYQVTIKNNTDREQVFIGIVKDETNEEVYSNTSIQPNVETAGGITGITEYETIIAPGEYLTFPVTYSYAGTDTANSELQGKINFRFRELPIIDLTNDGETYTLENISAGHVEEYEFTVSNYNENYNNGVPLTYTLETTLTEGSPLEAKIYDEDGLEVTGDIRIAGDGTSVDHTYTLKLTWDSSLTSTDYEGKSYTSKVKLKSVPDDTDYAEYSIEKEFGVDITTCAHIYENGACTICGKECVHNFQCGICTTCGKIATVKAGEKAEEKSEYSDGTDIAVIPKGFTVSGISTENTIDEGLVIYLINDKTNEEIEAIDWTNGTTVANLQKTYDQFVWIPVENINDMYMCQSEDGTKSCNITVEEDVAICTTHNSTSMAGRLSYNTSTSYYDMNYTGQVYKANSGYREPDWISAKDDNSTNLGYLNTILGKNFIQTTSNTNKTENNDLKTYLQKEYNEVVKSVYENEGFYVGRYETSNITTTNNTAANVVQGVTPTVSINWYYMYAQEVNYATNKGITSSVGSTMIQGAAYDQVLRYVHNGEKYDGTLYDVTTAGEVAHNLSALYNTGSKADDLVKNIYDLEGNARTWTCEAAATNERMRRGGTYNTSLAAKQREAYDPTSTGYALSSVIMLYINTAHTFGEWEITSPATCVSTGTLTRTCSQCGKVETQIIEKTELTVEVSNVTETGATITAKDSGNNGDTLQYTLVINNQTYGPSTTNMWNVTGLAEDTTYSYTITVTDGNETITKTGTLTTLSGNTAPAITHNYDYKSGTTKTTTKFTIRMRATDVDGDSLTYKLLASTSQSGTYYEVGTATATSGSYTTIAVTAINGTSLKQYTQYWWKLQVTDGKDNVTSEAQSLRTYCPGTGLTCSEATKCAPTITEKGCDTCKKTGTVACSGRITNLAATSLGLPDVCDRCGGNQPRGAFVWFCESKTYPYEILHYLGLTQCENCDLIYGWPVDEIYEDCSGAPCQICGGSRICDRNFRILRTPWQFNSKSLLVCNP